jgi:hypothetical protein
MRTRLTVDHDRRHVGLRQPLHSSFESARFIELLDCQTMGVRRARARAAQPLVPIVEVLRQLLDDLGLSRRRQLHRGHPRAEIIAPVRHGPPR